MYKNWSEPAAFIFDWNKRYNCFSIYRITKEIISEEEYTIPRYLKYLGSYGVRENFELNSDIDIFTLKSGRWHWKGIISGTWDYWGEFEEAWETRSLMRIR